MNSGFAATDNLPEWLDLEQSLGTTDPPLRPDVIEFLDDHSLLEAYQQTGRQRGNPFIEELLAEIERRNLDI